MTDDDPVRQCLRGVISPEVALARLLLAGETAESIKGRVEALACRDDASDRLARMLASRGPALRRLRAMIDAVAPEHAGATTPAAVGAMFDRAVAASPEASVALYSLGDPAVLAAATDEVVAWLRRNRLLAPDSTVLDLGCGIGRVAVALAPHVRFVLGIDVSFAMLREAAKRCRGTGPIGLAATSGRDLAACRDRAFDLVLAVDSFPYLVQTGLAERHFSEAARVLRKGGVMTIFNLSYRNDPARDRRDACAWAGRHGFAVQSWQPRALTIWDASAVVLRVG